MSISILQRWFRVAIKFSVSLFLVYVASLTAASAESLEAIEYEYDAAGNLIGYTRSVSTGVPAIDALFPPFINREASSRVRVLGQNFAGASVSSEQVGLSVSDVNIISNTEIMMTVSAGSDLTIGLADLTVASALGSDTAQIIVADRIPIISTDPNPILLTVDADPRSVSLSFDRPYQDDQIYAVNIVNDSVASISTSSLVLPAGQTEVSLEITATNTGNTALEITQVENFLALSIPVIVTGEFDLPSGDTSLSSRPLGVLVKRFEQPVGEQSMSSLPLGVLRNSSAAVNFGALFTSSDPLGVTKKSSEDFVPDGPLSVTTRPLGVTVNGAFELPLGAAGFQSNPVGTSKPPYLLSKSPEEVTRGQSISLVLSGVGLDQVTAIDFSPNTGISQPNGFQVNPAGTEITLTLDVDVTTTIGSRRIVIRKNTEQVPFITTGLESIQIISN